MKLVAHSLVKNEDQWIWYAINSVLDAVDEIMVWDTGSTDNTVPIIKSISSPKIKFKLRLAPTPQEMTQARQDMLDQTNADWLMILDGDEIWTPPALKGSLDTIHSQNPYYLVSSFINLIGDVYHCQENLAGKYHIGSHRGFVTIRFFNLSKLGRLKYQRGYPDEMATLSTGESIQNFHSEQAPKISHPYLHASNLLRTSSPHPETINRSHIFKYELGQSMPREFPYPKAFYYSHPEIVPSPWSHRTWAYTLNAAWQTPLKYLKRRI